MSFKNLVLQKGKDRALQRRHPWIFSGAFKNIPNDVGEGEIVTVSDHCGNLMATGFFQRGSIAVKVLSFTPVQDIPILIKTKIEKALAYRRMAGIFDLPGTDCCRLIFAEGDGLPGLIADRYAETAVIQIHHCGWLPFLDLIADVLCDTGMVSHVYHKVNEKLRLEEDRSGDIRGKQSTTIVSEYGNKFKIDWKGGQKTGFFLDQRENRRRLSELTRGKRVLNTFSYTGGFSVYALKAGAEEVVSVDISKAAIELANENARLNDSEDKHSGIAADVFDYLQNKGREFDLVVLDPPAFSKSRKTTHNAVQGYKRLNQMAIQNIRKGGIIFTFSCSQHIAPKLFEDTIRAAAIEAGRPIRIMEKLSQPADHPMDAFYPEGEYLKGLVLYVE